jgi:hypothetical protein
MTAGEARLLMARFAREGETREGTLNWDEATQRYLVG